MDNNEISRLMDVKLDIPDKRPDSLKYKAWRRCDVKIVAIKCFPCFLRISFQPLASDPEQFAHPADGDEHKGLTVSVNVPGVKVSLAVSRTKQHSYGLFWTHNRRDCYIYMALDTEESCARHMKWIKKSIKNLELYRQVFLEQRRHSRGPQRSLAQGVAGDQLAQAEARSARGPLPKLPHMDSFQEGFASRVSDIYEEIFDGPSASQPKEGGPAEPRLSRRLSRSSIASGIYEEMKPTTSNFNAILEEVLAEGMPAAAVPPVPPPRKRINTFETASDLGELPRCNTNPESELAKKKKYKNVFDNIFGSGSASSGGAGRSKRAESLSENAACTVADILTPRRTKKHPQDTAIYANELAAPVPAPVNKRNSFSSPDLSKINLLDTFDEANVADILGACDTSGSSDQLDLSFEQPQLPPKLRGGRLCGRADSLESLNVSEQLPHNFNFSACNTSTINLIGSNGAVAALQHQQNKNKILCDDLTGYCLMAPIVKKCSTTLAECSSVKGVATAGQLVATESGYSTAGSYCSSIASTATQVSELRPAGDADGPKISVGSKEDSAIYENMYGGSANSSTALATSATATPPNSKFIDNLYENLLAIKAAQELASSLTPPIALSTSTPTDSPQTATVGGINEVTPKRSVGADDEEAEDYYQTPRKSIISVDDKVPSYYPNSCDTVKMRRQPQSPPTKPEKQQQQSVGLRQLVNMRIRRDRPENHYISSPQKIMEQRQGSTASSKSPASKSAKKSTAAAHKIADNVYAVNHAVSAATRRSTTTAALTTSTATPTTTNNNNSSAQANNNNRSDASDRECKELLQLSMLQKIDFKFDDHQRGVVVDQENPATESRANDDASEENIYQSVKTPKRVPAQHHLQLNQTDNTTASKELTSANSANGTPPSCCSQSKVVAAAKTSGDLQLSAVKKFASLPRFKRIDFSPLKLRINNVLQRNQHQEF